MNRGGKSLIKFELPDAVSPMELNESQDTRQLALQIKEIRIDTTFSFER